MKIRSLIENLKEFKVKLKCDRCKGYIIVPALEIEIRSKCRCGGVLSPIEIIMRWKYRGYDCEIKRNNYFGTYMGYVNLKSDNIFFEKNCKEIENMGIEVHGGLTYADYNNGDWRIGFDTAHGLDYIPIFKDTALDKLKCQLGIYVWTLEGVKQEVEKIVDQLEI